MKKIFLMQPRQSGKTTKAIYEFIKDPNNSLFVTTKIELAKEIHNKVGGDSNKFISCNEFRNKVLGNKTPKNIILDEYMFFKNKDEIYQIINSIQPQNVYVFSTSDKIYNKKIFDFVKENKRTTSHQDLLKKYCKELTYGGVLTDDFKKQIYDLYYNFLTDEDTVLIDYDFSRVREVNRRDLVDLLGENQYNIEIINSYLI